MSVNVKCINRMRFINESMKLFMTLLFFKLYLEWIFFFACVIPVFTASHAPYKWDYWPHDDVRAECRFVGLTNLGATCYLASTIQQLYMIPEARQAIFTAKVGSGVSPPLWAFWQKVMFRISANADKVYKTYFWRRMFLQNVVCSLFSWIFLPMSEKDFLKYICNAVGS